MNKSQVSISGVTDVPSSGLYGTVYDKNSKAFIFKDNFTKDSSQIRELKRRVSSLEDRLLNLEQLLTSNVK